MSTKKSRVVVQACRLESCTTALQAMQILFKVIVEKSVPSKQLLKRRIKKLGAIKVVGRVAFTLYIKILARLSNKRVGELIETLHLNTQAPPNTLLKRVSTANSDEVITLLQKLNPDAVIVNGTRILSKKILDCIDKPFINTHVGITPKYRGVHGGYWALAKGDAKNCGVTVHLVDPGIDTGGVLYQDTIEIDSKDNFCTYPILQLAKALPLMRKSLEDVVQNNLKTQSGALPPNYSPTRPCLNISKTGSLKALSDIDAFNNGLRAFGALCKNPAYTETSGR